MKFGQTERNFLFMLIHQENYDNDIVNFLHSEFIIDNEELRLFKSFQQLKDINNILDLLMDWLQRDTIHLVSMLWYLLPSYYSLTIVTRNNKLEIVS